MCWCSHCHTCFSSNLTRAIDKKICSAKLKVLCIGVLLHTLWWFELNRPTVLYQDTQAYQYLFYQSAYGNSSQWPMFSMIITLVAIDCLQTMSFDFLWNRVRRDGRTLSPTHYVNVIFEKFIITKISGTPVLSRSHVRVWVELTVIGHYSTLIALCVLSLIAPLICAWVIYWKAAICPTLMFTQMKQSGCKWLNGK